MSTYKTKNPLGSAAVKDLYDNAENVDKFVNDRTKEELEDRLGVLRKTWHGMEMIFSRFIDYITGRGELQTPQGNGRTSVTRLFA
nr:hypothetical protein [Klebsiella pneumoniae]